MKKHILALGFLAYIAASCGSSSGGLAPEASTVSLSVLGSNEGQVPFVVVFQASGTALMDTWDWDFDGDGIVDQTTGDSSVAHSYPDPGEFQARVTGKESSTGEQGSAEHLVRVLGEILPVLQVNPSSGVRPLAVQFTPGASTATPINGWRMDYDGDGAFDTGWNPHPVPQAYTYYDAGTYEPMLEVRGFNGEVESTTAIVTVVNATPVVSISLNPSNGPAPLNTNISVGASSANGAITYVRIDPGDGSPPIIRTSPGNVSHTYSAAGRYPVTVLVRDVIGEELMVVAPDLDVFAGVPGSPTARVTVSPSSGAAPLAVSLNPSSSFDSDGQIVRYEWDFDYMDSTFTVDQVETSAVVVNAEFLEAGNHYVALRVVDDEGKSGIDVGVAEVVLVGTVVILDDTIDPGSTTGATASSRVQTSITANSRVRVFVADSSRLPVQVLFEGDRPSGTYEDIWDGKDALGNVVGDGDYYAFLEFEIEGQTVVEPHAVSGGTYRLLTGTELPTQGGGFDPWQNEFWQLSLSTANVGPCRMTIGISPFRVHEVVRTLALNEILGTGNYVRWWDGIQDDGLFVPEGLGSGESFLWSARAWTLPDNAIVVEGGRPVISDPRADPNVFHPGSALCPDNGVHVEFEVDVDFAQLEARVLSLADGSLVQFLDLPGGIPGTQGFTWDGRLATGEFAPEGAYRIEIRAMDGTNTSKPRSVLCVLAF